MWSEKYNPMVCFDALYSTSEGQSLEVLGSLESCSGSRIALPGGGYIDLPGIDSPPEQEESTFHSNRLQTTEPLSSGSESRIALPGGGYIDLPGVESPPEQDEHIFPSDIFHNNSGSRIELPGGGFINLPGLESPSEQEETFPSDIFQDYGLLEENRTLPQQEHDSSLVSGFQSTEITQAHKDQIIIQQERDNKRLREHLNRFMRIVTDRNFELHSLRSEAWSAIRDLRSRVARLNRRNKSLYEELEKRDSAIAALLCEACSAPLLRRMLEKGKKDRDKLEEKLDEMEKCAYDLMTKNSVLEHELTVIPKEMMSMIRLIEQGKKEHEELQEKLDEMEKSVQDWVTKNNALEHEMTVIQKEILSRESLIEKGKKECDELQEKLDAKEKCAQDLMTKNSALEHRTIVFQKEVMYWESLMEKGEKERKELQDKLDALEKCAEDLNTKSRALEHRTTVFQKEVMYWEGLIEKGEKERKELQDKLDALEKCATDLKTKNKALEHRTTVFQKEVMYLESLIEKGEKERKELQDKLDALEKCAQDLMTKNSVLEHELTVIPKEIMSRSNSKSFIKAEVHTQGTYSVCKDPSTNDADQCCVTATVSEQKTCQASKEDDPEQILVLQSQLVPASEKKDNLLKKAMKVLTLSRRRRITSKPPSQLHPDSLKRKN